jgi:hypothetical protein
MNRRGQHGGLHQYTLIKISLGLGFNNPYVLGEKISILIF